MPELPEVEVSRLGLLPHLVGRRIEQAVFRTPKLRHELPPALAERLIGRRIDAILRRGKYLLFDCESQSDGGWLILHLGMSGSLRLVSPGAPLQKHDHVDLVCGQSILRFRDPRRFGTLVWQDGARIEEHPLIAIQGIEPLSPEFDARWLHAATRQRVAPIKTMIMDSHLIVGIGNIYAAESLFLARISPLRPAGRLTRPECERLHAAIKDTLERAVAAGGSSVRDYVHSDGGAGSFQLSCAVYGRAGEPCPSCHLPIRNVRQGGRSTFYCAHCQK